LGISFRFWVTATRRTHLANSSDCTSGGDGRIGIPIWGKAMSYRIVYNEMTAPCGTPGRRQGTAGSEEFSAEHQALGRARELLEDGEHHGVAVRDHRGNELSGVRLQLKLGGFSGD
jgi:hypothetical protein